MAKREVKKVIEIGFTQEQADRINEEIKEVLQDRKRVIIKGRTEYEVKEK